jgi:thiosulfate/3-mercaptopyruvate sulfurtransferase
MTRLKEPRRGLRALAVALLTLSALEGAAGQSNARDQLLVTTHWLQQHLQDRDVVLLHVGEKPEYDAAHIPGARFITMRDISAPPPADHMSGEILELPDAAELRAKLEALGVSDRSRIIVYYGKDWVSPSTRVIFTLDWLGLGERTSLLDGGMQLWKRESRPVTAELPAIKPGKLRVKPVKQLTVNAEWVNAHRGAKGYALLDGRARAFYDGVESGMSKSGHVPGAGSFPFTTVTTDSLRLEPAELLKQRFAKAGVKPGDTVVGYCHIGQQVTAVLFAARTLGYKVLLYDGSFHDWEKRDLPVETVAQVKPSR